MPKQNKPRIAGYSVDVDVEDHQVYVYIGDLSIIIEQDPREPGFARVVLAEYDDEAETQTELRSLRYRAKRT